MREREFRQWMATAKARYGRPYKESTIGVHVRQLLNVEKSEKTNLEEEYKENCLERLIALYTYDSEDIRTRQPNRTNMDIKQSALASSLPAIKSQLVKYQRFCLDNNPQ